VKFRFSPRFPGSLHGLDQRSLLVKPWCVLVLEGGVSEDFLVASWRQSNRPPLDSRLPGYFRCRGCVGVEVAGSVLFLGPVALQWLCGFGKRKVEVRSV
jgi:hypothetical protein